MVKIRLVLVLLMAATTCTRAQDTTLNLSTRLFDADQLINLSSSQGWVFRAGNSPDWARVNLNTSNWTKRNPSTLSVNDADPSGWAQGWFRLRFRLDSTFTQRPIAFEKNSWAAADLYIDGQLLASYGNTGVNGKPYREHSPRYKPPLLIELTPGRDHILALHLVDHTAPLMPNQLKSEVLGQPKRLLLVLGPQPLADSQLNGQLFPIFTSFWLAVTLLLTLLFWLLSFQELYETKVIRLLSVWGTLSTLANLAIFLYVFDIPFILGFVLWPVSWILYFVSTPFLILALVQILGYIPSRQLKGLVISIGVVGGLLGFYTGTFASGSFANLLQFFVFLYWLIPSWKNVQGALWVLVVGAFLAISVDLTFTITPHLKPLLWFLVITGSKLSLPSAFIIYIALRFKEIVAEDRAKATAVVQITEEKRQLLATQNQRLEQQVEARTAELKASQAQLIQKEKLASLGELTAGIAHEIQNPLNFVNNFSEVSVELIDELESEMTNGDPEEAKAIAGDLRQNLQKIHHHGGRASSIVKGMLEHSRTESGEKRPTDLNALADEYFKIAYHGLKAKDKSFSCEIVTHFDPSLTLVEVAPQEIGRVLLNLYNNAFYAVSERARKMSVLEYKPRVEIRTYRQADQILIQVKDNGTGIPDSVKAKIFQPFFTTKPTGEGTGLGLSLSYDIVTKGHGGTLRMESQVGVGATFVIELPQR